MAKQIAPSELTINGREYVVMLKADYLRMSRLPPGMVDAKAFARSSISAALKAARDEAGLTQLELAKRLGKSQPLVAQTESGAMVVGERYVLSVLRACGLKKDWRPAKGMKD